MKRILMILTAALFSYTSYSQVVMGRDITTTSKEIHCIPCDQGIQTIRNGFWSKEVQG